jgi:aerobic-type carbon monoxide dehydrogenase small subunit (CoxS/CutS family)
MQAAFIKYDGYQCGYCPPGQICSAVATLAEIKAAKPLLWQFRPLQRIRPGSLSITHKWLRSISFARRESDVILCLAPIRERCDGRGSDWVA